MKRYQGKEYPGTDISIPPAEQAYASMVEGMDASLGALLKHLDTLGVAENTLVIFTSDNGGLSAHARSTSPRNTGKDTHNWPLRGGKGSAYEGGTRVPFLVAWAKPDPESKPQQALPLKAGSSSDQPLLCEDLFPTVLGLAGVELPADRAIDGHDMRPYWTGTRSAPDRPLVFHYPHVWGPRGEGYQPHSAMRLGAFKVVYFYNARKWELYNLADDIGETKDLADSHPDRLRQLARRLLQEMRRMGAQWPVDRETGEPDSIRLPGA